MATKYTNIYLPNSNGRLIYAEDDDESAPEASPEEEKQRCSSIRSMLSPGFSDAWKENKQYLELLEKLLLGSMDTKRLMETVSPGHTSRAERTAKTEYKSLPDFYIKVIYLSFYHQKPQHEIACKLDLPLKDVRR